MARVERAAGGPTVSAPLAPMPWVLLAASCLAMFAVTASGSSRAPFLLDMARDLDVGLGMVANLFGLTSIAWGVTSFLAGIGSDRLGRRPFLVGAPIALALALVAVADSDGFLAVAVWATVAGGCSGLYTGVSLAEVAGRVVDRQRARALGWVMAGQSLTLLIGVPVAAWLGAYIGWRGVHICVAALALVSAIGMFLSTMPAAHVADRLGVGGAIKPPSLRSAFSPLVLKLLSSVIAERICFGLAAVYYATFLITSYELTLDLIALPLFVFALGNILGTVLGGQIGDRVANRVRAFSVALIASGAVALVLFAWDASLIHSVALGFLYSLCNALARPPLMAALAAVPPEVRGTVMGLNSTAASVGWLSAAALGGWMLTGIGFQGFGPLILVLTLVGAAIAHMGPRIAADR